MYLEIIDQYPAEFGHFNLASENGAMLANPRSLMHSEIAQFVDLNNGTTDFTNDVFHNFADSFLATIENWSLPEWIITPNVRSNRNDWEDLSSSYAFSFESRFSNPGFAF
jgi:hypothetical protein